ncbi:MAG: replication-associated recombination protein A, partial [Promicromonosporaceae bacterium]|nr:replication-associated recombination protein A [Promicromonosporaceae bacterium]
PKSNSVVGAVNAAFADAEKGDFMPVPVHLRDTSYKGSERFGSGVGYLYPHDYPGHYVPQRYLPIEAAGTPYYVPSDQGQEARIAERKRERGDGGR